MKDICPLLSSGYINYDDNNCMAFDSSGNQYWVQHNGQIEHDRPNNFNSQQAYGFGADFKGPQPSTSMPQRRNNPGEGANFERYSEDEKKEQQNKLKISFILSAIENTMDRHVKTDILKKGELPFGFQKNDFKNNDRLIHVGMRGTRKNMRYYLEYLEKKNKNENKEKLSNYLPINCIIEDLNDLRLYAENKPEHMFVFDDNSNFHDLHKADLVLKDVLDNLKHRFGEYMELMSQEILDVFKFDGEEQLKLNFKCYNDIKYMPKKHIVKAIKQIQTSSSESEKDVVMFNFGVLCGSMDSQHVREVPNSRRGINRKRGMKRKMRGAVNESPLQKRQYELVQKIRKYEKKIAQLDELIEMKLRQQ